MTTTENSITKTIVRPPEEQSEAGAKSIAKLLHALELEEAVFLWPFSAKVTREPYLDLHIERIDQDVPLLAFTHFIHDEGSGDTWIDGELVYRLWPSGVITLKECAVGGQGLSEARIYDKSYARTFAGNLNAHGFDEGVLTVNGQENSGDKRKDETVAFALCSIYPYENLTPEQMQAAEAVWNEKFHNLVHKCVPDRDDYCLLPWNEAELAGSLWRCTINGELRQWESIQHCLRDIAFRATGRGKQRVQPLPLRLIYGYVRVDHLTPETQLEWYRFHANKLLGLTKLDLGYYTEAPAEDGDDVFVPEGTGATRAQVEAALEAALQFTQRHQLKLTVKQDDAEGLFTFDVETLDDRPVSGFYTEGSVADAHEIYRLYRAGQIETASLGTVDSLKGSRWADYYYGGDILTWAELLARPQENRPGGGVKASGAHQVDDYVWIDGWVRIDRLTPAEQEEWRTFDAPFAWHKQVEAWEDKCFAAGMSLRVRPTKKGAGWQLVSIIDTTPFGEISEDFELVCAWAEAENTRLQKAEKPDLVVEVIRPRRLLLDQLVRSAQFPTKLGVIKEITDEGQYGIRFQHETQLTYLMPAMVEEAPLLEACLYQSLHCYEGADSRWEAHKQNGLTDADLKVAIGEAFGEGGSSHPTWHWHKGGKEPKFWLAMGGNGKPALQGKALLAKVRSLLELPQPKPVAEAEAVIAPTLTYRQKQTRKKHERELERQTDGYERMLYNSVRSTTKSVEQAYEAAETCRVRIEAIAQEHGFTVPYWTRNHLDPAVSQAQVSAPIQEYLQFKELWPDAIVLCFADDERYADWVTYFEDTFTVIIALNVGVASAIDEPCGRIPYLKLPESYLEDNHLEQLLKLDREIVWVKDGTARVEGTAKPLTVAVPQICGTVMTTVEVAVSQICETGMTAVDSDLLIESDDAETVAIDPGEPPVTVNAELSSCFEQQYVETLQSGDIIHLNDEDCLVVGIYLTGDAPDICVVLQEDDGELRKVLFALNEVVLVRPGDAPAVTVAPTPIATAPAVDPKFLKRAKRLRSVANGFKKEMQSRYRAALKVGRLTHKRKAEADQALWDYQAAARKHALLNTLAEQMEAGTVPEVLQGLSAWTQVDTVLNGTFEDSALISIDTVKGMLGEILRDYLPEADQAHFDRLQEAMERTAQKAIAFNSYGFRGEELTALEKIAAYAAERTHGSSVMASLAPKKRLKDAGIETKEKFLAAVAALEALKTEPEIPLDLRIASLEREIDIYPHDGYFPTPTEVSAVMVKAAALDVRPVLDPLQPDSEGEAPLTVWEPESGKGSLAAIISRVPGITLVVGEYQEKMRDLLALKGFNVVSQDALAHDGQYDRIISNPPFINLCEIDHIRHHYGCLKPGGRLVSLLSPSPLTSSQQKAVEFRAWLETVGAHEEALPPGSFKKADRAVGASIHMIVIAKPLVGQPMQKLEGLSYFPEPEKVVEPKVKDLIELTDSIAVSERQILKLLEELGSGFGMVLEADGETPAPYPVVELPEGQVDRPLQIGDTVVVLLPCSANQVEVVGRWGQLNHFTVFDEEPLEDGVSIRWHSLRGEGMQNQIFKRHELGWLTSYKVGDRVAQGLQPEDRSGTVTAISIKDLGTAPDFKFYAYPVVTWDNGDRSCEVQQDSLSLLATVDVGRVVRVKADSKYWGGAFNGRIGRGLHYDRHLGGVAQLAVTVFGDQVLQTYTVADLDSDPDSDAAPPPKVKERLLDVVQKFFLDDLEPAPIPTLKVGDRVLILSNGREGEITESDKVLKLHDEKGVQRRFVPVLSDGIVLPFDAAALEVLDRDPNGFTRNQRDAVERQLRDALVGRELIALPDLQRWSRNILIEMKKNADRHRLSANKPVHDGWIAYPSNDESKDPDFQAAIKELKQLGLLEPKKSTGGYYLATLEGRKVGDRLQALRLDVLCSRAQTIDIAVPDTGLVLKVVPSTLGVQNFCRRFGLALPEVVQPVAAQTDEPPSEPLHTKQAYELTRAQYRDRQARIARVLDECKAWEKTKDGQVRITGRLEKEAEVHRRHNITVDDMDTDVPYFRYEGKQRIKNPHEQHIILALQERRAIPEAVLEDYPDWQGVGALFTQYPDWQKSDDDRRLLREAIHQHLQSLDYETLQVVAATNALLDPDPLMQDPVIEPVVEPKPSSAHLVDPNRVCGVLVQFKKPQQLPEGACTGWDVYLVDERFIESTKKPIFLGQTWKETPKGLWFPGHKLLDETVMPAVTRMKYAAKRLGGAFDLFYAWSEKTLIDSSVAVEDLQKRVEELHQEFLDTGSDNPPVRAWIEAAACDILRDQLLGHLMILTTTGSDAEPAAEHEWGAMLERFEQQIQALYALYNRATFRVELEVLTVKRLRAFGVSISNPWKYRELLWLPYERTWMLRDREGRELTSPSLSELAAELLLWHRMPGNDPVAEMNSDKDSPLRAHWKQPEKIEAIEASSLSSLPEDEKPLHEMTRQEYGERNLKLYRGDKGNNPPHETQDRLMTDEEAIEFCGRTYITMKYWAQKHDQAIPATELTENPESSPLEGNVPSLQKSPEFEPPAKPQHEMTYQEYAEHRLALYRAETGDNPPHDSGVQNSSHIV